MLDKIYIPTFRRADIQITYDNLPDEYKEKVIMVVQEQERKDYNYDVEYLVVGNDIGIAKTRELICRDAGKTRFSMVDDDVIFYRRNQKYFRDYNHKSNMDRSKRISTKDDLDEMFALFDQWMDDDIIHIGHRRSNLPPVKMAYSDTVFFNAIHHINGELLSEIIDDINWTRCEVGEDANLMFEYLSRGYENRRSDEFVAHWDSFQEGGCSVFRDSKLHNQEHEKLHKHWGSNVVFVSKETIGQGSNGHNIGLIKEFSYRPKRTRKKYLMSTPKKQFQKEIDKRVKK